jgi:hypothetical protein
MKSAAGKTRTNCKKAIMRVRMPTLYHRVHCGDKGRDVYCTWISES